MRTRPPAGRLRALDADAPDARRFSPLNAPQRAAVEAFCTEAERWATRQARRTYGHLPTEMRRQAIDRAMRELRLGAPPALDRQTLYATLSDELTEQLRRVHAGWCLNAVQGQWRKEGPVAVPDADDSQAATQSVARFVEGGLGGLERAVLQLEIGAGRDTRTSRAALRLGPRQYERHREEGLSKLRSAINGHASGRVCEDHLDAVILAATGDRAALEALTSGPERCRACAREASGLRRVLQERLAVAPWPLAIKPAGLIAAKLGFLGTVVAGKSAGTTGLGAVAGTGPFGTGAGAIAGVLAAAAVATGTAAVVDGDHAPTLRHAATPAAQSQAASAPAAAAAPAEPRRASGTSAKAEARAERRRAATRRQAAVDRTPAAPAATGAAPSASTQAQADPQAPPAGTSKPSVKETVGGAVDGVRKAVDPVTTKLPPTVQQPVDEVLDGVQGTVDEVTGTVDGLLPK
jgi:hypothetical protein